MHILIHVQRSEFISYACSDSTAAFAQPAELLISTSGIHTALAEHNVLLSSVEGIDICCHASDRNHKSLWNAWTVEYIFPVGHASHSYIICSGYMCCCWAVWRWTPLYVPCVFVNKQHPQQVGARFFLSFLLLLCIVSSMLYSFHVIHTNTCHNKHISKEIRSSHGFRCMCTS